MFVLVSPVLLSATTRRAAHGHVMLAASVVLGTYGLERLAAGGLSAGGVDELHSTVLVVILVTTQQFALQSIGRQRDMADRAREQEARALAALAERNEELVRREEVERDLHVAVERAEDASHAKSDFPASMSHELRTPRNAIIGDAEMLGEEVQGSVQQSDLGRIERSGRHLLTLINDVLDRSKVDAGRMELDPEEVDLGDLLEEVVGEVRPLVEERGNRLVVTDEAIGRELVLDRVRTQQVLLDLLSNAATFTENGTVELSVRSDTGDDREVVVFEVRDAGTGISVSDQSRLFRPLVQVDTQPSCRKGGTGLGLVLSRSFAERMDGSVGVRSELGVGSTFTFVVPTRAPQAVVDVLTARRVAQARRSQQPVALCVGVHAAELDVLDRRLGQEGLLAVPVRQAERAVALARELVPAILVVDLHGEGSDGRTLLGQVRSDPSLDAVGVILCSSEGGVTLPSLPKVTALYKPIEASALRGGDPAADPWGAVDAEGRVGRPGAPQSRGWCG